MIVRRAGTFVVALMTAACVVRPVTGQDGKPAGRNTGQPALAAPATAGTGKAVRFSGSRMISSETLERTVHSGPGHPYDAGTVTEDIARIQKLYASRGWSLARVRDAELQPDGTLLFNVMEGVIDKVSL